MTVHTAMSRNHIIQAHFFLNIAKVACNFEAGFKEVHIRVLGYLAYLISAVSEHG